MERLWLPAGTYEGKGDYCEGKGQIGGVLFPLLPADTSPWEKINPAKESSENSFFSFKILNGLKIFLRSS